MIFATSLMLMGGMALMLVRLLRGPQIYDRVLAVNSFGTKTVLFLCVFAFLIGRPDAVDIALLYALMNFIATIAILKFSRYRALDIALSRMRRRGAK
jgi:multicomponent Na+:H+ antiporter subunit F